LQIWVQPDQAGNPPGYEQKNFPVEARKGRLALVASKDGREGSIRIHADAAMYAGVFESGDSASFELPAGRHLWLHVAKGAVMVNGERLEAGDAAFSKATVGGVMRVEGEGAGEVLLFDLH
jgi:hypothetical protein